MTVSLTGLLSNSFDWQSMVSQIQQADDQQVTVLQNQQSTYKSQLSAWQTFNTKLSALQSAASDLQSSDAFNVYTATTTSSSSSVSADSLLTATASASASQGTYQVTVNNMAQPEKLASQSFSSASSALGVSGTILVNGQAVDISAGDSLSAIQNNINELNTGDTPSNVVASIIQNSTNSYRLVLTSQTEGAAGISLQDGSANDVLGSLGFNNSGTVIKNQATGGALSDSFTSATTAVETLLGNSSQNLSGTVTINGTPVNIDLSDSLTTIKDNLVNAGISASLVPKTDGSDTTYQLEIEGMTSWTDSNNVLQSLGLIQGNRSDSIGVTGGNANTTDGQTPITASTPISQIYGYLNWQSGDTISISGTQHDGTQVSDSFSIGQSSTVQDLLNQIQSDFGSVTASVTSDGKIQVVDNATGTSQLSLSLTANLTGSNPGTLDFGTFTNVGTVRSYVLQQGQDASFTVDGMQMTSSSNTVTNAIPGVTLNVQGADPATPVTLNVNQDSSAIQKKVQTLVNAYNDAISFVNTQMSYNSDTKTTGGPLFGDTLLTSTKQTLQSTMLSQVFGTTNLTALSSVGLTFGDNGQLSFDTDTFTSELQSNPSDVAKLFADSGSSSNNQLQYVDNSSDTQPGTYAVDITQAATQASLAGSGINWSGGYSGATGDQLTVADSVTGKSASLSLTSGESLSDIVNGLNSTLDNAGIDMTASVDSSGQLQISQNTYGSGRSFTLSYSGGAQAALGFTTNTADGQDVAGTIGGVAAAGSGQSLQVNDSTSAADGLMISYSGTTTGNVGDFTFSRGVASTLENQLNTMTDSIDGSIVTRENSVQTDINQLGTKITDTQNRIQASIDLLTQSFQNMDQSLSKMQSMQSYLSTQLASLS